MDDVVLDLEVLRDELGRIGGIGVDTAYLGSSQDDIVRLLGRKKVAYGLLLIFLYVKPTGIFNEKSLTE